MSSELRCRNAAAAAERSRSNGTGTAVTIKIGFTCAIMHKRSAQRVLFLPDARFAIRSRARAINIDNVRGAHNRPNCSTMAACPNAPQGREIKIKI